MEVLSLLTGESILFICKVLPLLYIIDMRLARSVTYNSNKNLKGVEMLHFRHLLVRNMHHMTKCFKDYYNILNFLVMWDFNPEWTDAEAKCWTSDHWVTRSNPLGGNVSSLTKPHCPCTCLAQFSLHNVAQRRPKTTSF